MPCALRVYGVGDHGGGPTRRDILRAIDMQTWPIYATVEFGTFHQFFESAEPVFGNEDRQAEAVSELVERDAQCRRIDLPAELRIFKIRILQRADEASDAFLSCRIGGDDRGEVVA